MEEKDDRKNIHFNPEFFSRAEAQVKPRVHVNPAFLQTSRSHHGFTRQIVHSQCLSQTHDKSLPNNDRVPLHQSSTPFKPSKIPPGSAEHIHYGKFSGKGNISYPSVPVNFSSVQSRVLHTSATKPSTYTWRTNINLPHSYVSTGVSHLSESSKWLSNVKPPSSSRYKYQCQDASKNIYVKSNVDMSKSQGNKFKIDNRTIVQRLSDTSQIDSSFNRNLDMKRCLLETKNKFASKVTNVKNLDKAVINKVAKSTNSQQVVSKQKLGNQESSIVCSKGNVLPSKNIFSTSGVIHSDCSDTADRLNAVPSFGNKSPSSTNQKLTYSVDKLKSGLNCGEQNSVLSHPKEKVASMSSASTNSSKQSTSKSLHLKKCSNILINPLLLKSLSSNDKIDIVDVASKSSSQEINKSSTNMNTFPKGTSSLSSKYKLISKTKLVRHRSRSFSKGKTKANYSKEKPPDGKLTVSSQPVKRENSIVTLGRPSTKFPRVQKVYPKRRYALISRTKLIRRLSASSNSTEDVPEKPKYSIKTKTKLVKKHSSSSLKCPVTLDKLKLRSARVNVENKNYTVLSKTKLVRRKSNSGIMKTKGEKEISSVNAATIIRRHKLVRNAHLKTGRTNLFKYVDPRLSAKQKAARGIISKYRINRLRADLPSTRGIHSRQFTWISSKSKTLQAQAVRRRGAEKFSDRIVNIGGILYKATQTSLRKQIAKKSPVHYNNRVISRRNHLHSSRKGSNCIVRLHGNKYSVSAGGRTLTRIMSKPVSASGPSLSRVYIGGLTYSRTKTGHYELTQVHQARAVLSSAKQRSMMTLSLRKKRGLLQKRNQYCMFFNRFGRCAKKNKGKCPYLHDPKRVAVCTRFLRGRCPVSNCPFSHEIDPDKMPVCSHFVRTTCTREDCPYRHVRVNPNAPLCLDFLHGHCPLGQACKKQHVLECEEFSLTGKCPRGKACPLSHRKGSRKKRKSISLEPTTFSDSRRMSIQMSRHKSSDTLDVLGGPSGPPKLKRYAMKSVEIVPQRYFQVSEDDTVAVDNERKSTILLKDCEAVSEQKERTCDKENCNDLKESSPGLSCGGKGAKRLLGDEKVHEEESMSGALDLEQTQEKAMQKVEKLKQICHQSQPTENENEMAPSISKDKPDKQIEGNSNKEVISESSTDFECDAYERRPLPKRLPSFISLTERSGDVEDL